MANIAITTNCNLKCKYCFADEFVDNFHGEEMTFENYLLAKRFILKSNQQSFGLIGGEPSIHSKYKEILKDCIEDPNVLKVTIFTNGIHVKKFLKEYACSKFMFLINCNSPLDIGEERYKILTNNIKTLIEDYSASDRINFGINLYKQNQDFSYIIDICKRYKKYNVRVSVTIPQEKIDMKTYFTSMKSTLISFYKVCVENSITPQYDCNVIPSCMYTEKELFEMAKILNECGEERARLIGENCVCSPVIDILPNLTAIRCFGMSDIEKVPIKNFKNLTDLANYFTKEIDYKLTNKVTEKACESCYKCKTLQCYGGCLTFKK